MTKEIYFHLFLNKIDHQPVRDAIKELNEEQDIIHFSDIAKDMTSKESRFELNELYMNITMLIKEDRQLPNLITVTDFDVYSKASDNSSIRTHLTRSNQIGLVVLKEKGTTSLMKYQLLRTALQLALNKYLTHASEFCFFDRKMNINNVKFCNHCKNQLLSYGISEAEISILTKLIKLIKNESMGITKSNWLSVIIMDIVGYSKLTDSEQKVMIEKLQKIVKNNNFIANNEDYVLFLPTGDGCAIALEEDLRQLTIKICADLQMKIKAEGMKVRIGVNMGTVFTYRDINQNKNIAGGGINMAARAMDVGDANHIIANRTVWDALWNLNNWHREVFHDLGIVKVKHGVDLLVFNVYSEKEGFGNPEIPEKMREKT